MIVQGKVHSVETYPSGTAVVNGYSIGATVLEVGSILDLQETGGTVTILGAQYTYTLDVNTSLITISPGLAVAIEDGEVVLAYPSSMEKRVYAYVDDGADAVIATVPHALQGDLDEGIREETERETVILEEVRGSWMVQNIVALDPLSDIRTRQALSDAAAALVAAAAAQGTADGAMTSANGKNAITHTDHAPTTEANTLGDTWFVHDTDGTIIAQWQGLGGTSWQPTQLSHQVIASIDLGTATVGKLAANFIDTGVLAAALTVTGYLIAGNPTGARVVIDADGIRQYDADGNIAVNLPTDATIPAQFEGLIVADAITIKDYLSLQGLANEVARGAVLTVSGGTGAPLTPPSIAIGYPTYNPNRWSYLYVPVGVHGNADDTPDLTGVMGFFDGTYFFGPSNKVYTWPEVTDSAGVKRALYSNITNGAMVHTAAGAERFVTMGIRCLTAGAVSAGSMDSFDMSTMVVGGTVAPVAKAHVAMTPDSFNYYQTKVGRVFSAVGSTLYKERIAVAIRRVNTYNDIVLRQYTVADTGFTQVGTDANVTIPFANIDEGLIGVTHGSSDKLGFPGAAQFVWLIHSTTKTYAYTAPGLVRLPQFDFPTPAGAQRMYAFGDAATNQFLGFRTTEWNDKTVITKLTNNHWDTTTTSSKWWVSTTNYDNDITGGTHESTQGARASITGVKRAGLVITVPPYPVRPSPTTTDDPLAARIYVGRSTIGAPSADPGRTYMERMGELVTPNRTLALGTFTLPATTATTPPPSTSDFPQSSPGKIVSADGTSWSLTGDGKATLAGVLFDGAFPGFASSAMRPAQGSSGGVTTYTSTSFVDHASGPAVTFVAPPSGVMLGITGAFCKNNTAGAGTEVAIEVRTGTSRTGGTVFGTQAAIDNYNVEWIRATGAGLFTGLTPGATYVAHPVAKVTSGTGSVSIVYIIMVPMP